MPGGIYLEAFGSKRTGVVEIRWRRRARPQCGLTLEFRVSAVAVWARADALRREILGAEEKLLAEGENFGLRKILGWGKVGRRSGFGLRKGPRLRKGFGARTVRGALGRAGGRDPATGR